jgi:hypothetical protein
LRISGQIPGRNFPQRLKTEFSTKEGAEQGAVELKRRFPTLQIRIYDAAAQSRHDLAV